MVTDSKPNFSEVVRKLGGPLRGFLVNYCGNVDLAEDLLQETLIRVEKNLGKFRGESSLKTWVFRIATNAAIDHHRKQGSRVTVVPIDETEQIPDDVPEIGEPLVISEMNSCVREKIDSLPADYRAALVLHDLEGLTAAEVASICDISLATAKIRIHRGRQRLRKVLTEGCDFYYNDDLNLLCDRKLPDSKD